MFETITTFSPEKLLNKKDAWKKMKVATGRIHQWLWKLKCSLQDFLVGVGVGVEQL